MKSQLVENCQRRNDWPISELAIKAEELDLLSKYKVLGLVAVTPDEYKPVGREWVFVRNKRDEIVKYMT